MAIRYHFTRALTYTPETRPDREDTIPSGIWDVFELPTGEPGEDAPGHYLVGEHDEEGDFVPGFRVPAEAFQAWLAEGWVVPLDEQD